MHALDSSTMQLTLTCFDWARHWRQKAAAKLHMNLDLGNGLAVFAIVEEASHHDSVRAEATTANLKCEDILVADRAYADFMLLCSLAVRGVFCVVRWKRNIKLETAKSHSCDGGVLRCFIGHSENAVKWQVWTGLLVHMLLRCLRHISEWKHSFSAGPMGQRG